MGAALVAALIFLAPQIASAQSRPDSQIQADCNSKLQADPQLSNVSVGVGVQDGVVTLTGNVADDTQLTEAETDISGVQGIVKIADNLRVNATAPVASAPAGAENEAAQAAQNAQPPADADNGDTGMAGDTGQAQNGNPPNGAAYPGQPYPSQEPQPQGQNGPPQQGMEQPPPPPQGYGSGGQGNYAPYNRPRRVVYDPGNRQVTLAAGTVITMRTTQDVIAGKTPNGAIINGVVAQDIEGDQGVAVPRGAAISAQVVESKAAGHFKGAAVLQVKLANLTLGDQPIPLASDLWGQRSAGKGGATAGNAIGGAAFGAIIGAIAGGGPGAAIGAAAGGATGAAATGLERTPYAYIPAEGLVTFRLTAPVTVTTVTPAQARVLANAAPPMRQPMRRPPPPPGYYGPYGPYRPYPY